MKKTILILLFVGFTLTGGSLYAGNGDLIVSGALGVGTAAPGQKVTAAGVIESTNGGFKFPDGSIQATAAAKGYANVRDYGAAGDADTNGARDDTNAIQNALNANQCVFIPEGAYRISRALTVSGRVVHIRGAGVGSTKIIQSNLSDDGIRFDLNAHAVQGGSISGILLTSEVQEVAQGSSKTGLYIINANGNFDIHEIEVRNFDTACRIDGSWYIRLRNFIFRNFSNAGLLLYRTNGADINNGGGNSIAMGKISNIGYTGNNASSVGLLIEQASGDIIDILDISMAAAPVQVRPPSGSVVRNLKMHKVNASYGQSQNWWIDGLNGPIVSSEFSMCSSSDSQQAGIVISGANVSGLRWIGGWSKDNAFEGIQLHDGVNISFIDTEVIRNSLDNMAIYDGVKVFDGVNDWKFIDCRIGDSASTVVNPNTRPKSIKIEGSAVQNFQIVGCDLRDPGAGGSPIMNNSSSQNFLIKNNFPLQTVGTNVSDRVSLSGGSVTSIPAGSTRYLGPAGAVSDGSDSVWVVNRPGIVTGFYVANSMQPGAGQTYQYTVMRNRSATSMAVQASDLDWEANAGSANSFSVSPGDELTIRVVTSPGAGIPKLRYYISLEP